MDRISAEKRSWNMSHIRSKDTVPEGIVRKYLFSKGFRYRKNDSKLPGKPDIVLPKYKAVIFINGCFWHRHRGCKNSVMPKTNTAFWEEKLNRNVERDSSNYKKLENLGWKIIVIWECQLENKKLLNSELDKIVLLIKENYGQ